MEVRWEIGGAGEASGSCNLGKIWKATNFAVNLQLSHTSRQNKRKRNNGVLSAMATPKPFAVGGVEIVGAGVIW